MAKEMGLGITPWSPLKFGVLSGKFTREQHGKHDPSRGDWVRQHLNDRTYDIIDELIRISKELKSSPARVALSWVQNRAGVSSTIIGARTLEQLEDNVAALDLKLSPEHIESLDKISAPSLNFPHDFLLRSGSFRSAGTVINGEKNEPGDIHPKSEKEVFEGPLASSKR